MKYVAFLKGINVGGKSVIKMNELKTLFEAAGFTQVQTVLASGNVVFESEVINPDTITEKIEALLKKKWKREIPVFVRTIDELREMERSRPFKGIEIDTKMQLYVTFLYEFSRGLKIPELPSNTRIARMKDDAVFTVVKVTPEMNTTDAMAALNKALGPKITMRNWNTILKILRT
jgi:uncharacterized protein (DUF1697 family)